MLMGDWPPDLIKKPLHGGFTFRESSRVTVEAEQMMKSWALWLLSPLVFSPLSTYAFGTTPNAPPEPREYASFVSSGWNLVVFGGMSSGGLHNDVHYLDTRTLQWSGALTRPWCCVESQPMNEVGVLPSKRYKHTASVVDTRMYIFGGSSDLGLLNDVHIFDTAVMAWLGETSVGGDQPVERSEHAAAVVGGRIYIYGGRDQAGRILTDMHILDTSSLRWSQPRTAGSPPPPLSYFSLTAVPAAPSSASSLTELATQGRLLLFGGMRPASTDTTSPKRQCSQDLYEFDTATHRWQMVTASGPSPWPRHSHAAAYFPSPTTSEGGLETTGRGQGATLMVWGGQPSDAEFAPHPVGAGGTGPENSWNFTDVHVYHIDSDYWSGEVYLDQRPPARTNALTASVAERVYSYGGWEASTTPSLPPRLVGVIEVWETGWDTPRSLDLVSWLLNFE